MKKNNWLIIIFISGLGICAGTYLYLNKHSAKQMAKECREFQKEIVTEIKSLKNTRVDRLSAANNIETIEAKNKNLERVKNDIIKTLKNKDRDNRLLELIAILDSHCQLNELIATKNK